MGVIRSSSSSVTTTTTTTSTSRLNVVVHSNHNIMFLLLLLLFLVGSFLFSRKNLRLDGPQHDVGRTGRTKVIAVGPTGIDVSIRGGGVAIIIIVVSVVGTGMRVDPQGHDPGGIQDLVAVVGEFSRGNVVHDIGAPPHVAIFGKATLDAVDVGLGGRDGRQGFVRRRPLIDVRRRGSKVDPCGGKGSTQDAGDDLHFSLVMTQCIRNYIRIRQISLFIATTPQLRGKMSVVCEFVLKKM
jgi:hypothetical protein